jgi:hypothetical protein
MLTKVAVIAPVCPADPRAVTHCPTARFEEVALWVCEYVVLELVVTSTVFAGGVVVFVDLEDEELGRVKPPVWEKPSTVKPPDETAVTFPEAMLMSAKRLAPPGIDPLVGNVVRVPWLNWPPPLNPRPPKPPNAAPLPVQLPLEPGWLIMTVLAVIGPFVLLDPPAPDAVTHSPTVTADDGALTVWVNDVVGVQFTVT